MCSLVVVLQALVVAQQSYAKFLTDQAARSSKMDALRLASDTGGFAGGRARVELVQMERADETLSVPTVLERRAPDTAGSFACLVRDLI
jgi:hypothetical protein